MSPSTLADLFEKNPMQAYRLVLASGDRVVVANPRRTLISELELYLRQSDDIDEPVGKVSIVSIPNINLVEPIDRPPLAGSSRRRR